MDIYYHFMRRIASGCTSENHPLYGCSMASLSFSIYEWNPSDLDAIYKAKKEDFVQNGGTNADNYDPEKHVTKQELARHCRLTTRNSEEMKKVISQLLETFKSARDSLGAPLLRPEIDAIWRAIKNIAIALVTLRVLSCIGLCEHYKKATRSFLSTGVREVQNLLDSTDIENVLNSDSDS